MVAFIITETSDGVFQTKTVHPRPRTKTPILPKKIPTLRRQEAFSYPSSQDAVKAFNSKYNDAKKEGHYGTCVPKSG